VFDVIARPLFRPLFKPLFRGLSGIGNELLVNNDFTNGTSDWYPIRGESLLSVVGGNLVSAANGVATFGAGQQVDNLVVGDDYEFSATATCSNSSATVALRAVDSATLTSTNPLSVSGTGSVTANNTFTAVATTMYVGALAASHANTERVTNGDFTNGASDWQLSGHWVIGSNTAQMPATSSYLPLYQNDVFEALKTYVLNFDVIAVTGKIIVYEISNGAAANAVEITNFETTGAKQIIFTTSSLSRALAFARFNPINSSCTIDNVSVREQSTITIDSGISLKKIN
jgi:hypothetical protein